jgi:hypothetical protein
VLCKNQLKIVTQILNDSHKSKEAVTIMIVSLFYIASSTHNEKRCFDIHVNTMEYITEMKLLKITVDT